MTPTPTSADTPVARLVTILAQLREHCPWMGALTHESLVEYLLEEAFEVAETIESGMPEKDFDAELRGELGDVLLQVVLHARLAEERGAFTFDDVARGLGAKMVRRNPHVFRPDGSLQDTFPATVEEIVQTWDAVKRAERPARTSHFEGIPLALPALARAQKSLDRAARAGFRQAQPPVVEPGPTAAGFPGRAWEVRERSESETPFTTEDELGDYLFAVVRSAHDAGFDAERALRGAVRRYQQEESPSQHHHDVRGPDVIP